MSELGAVSRSSVAGRRAAHAVRHALGLALLLALGGQAQNTPPPSRPPLQQPIGQRAGDSLNGIVAGDPAEEEERLRYLNRERHKSMVSDANKLLKLAGEVNAEVQNGNSDSITPAQ